MNEEDRKNKLQQILSPSENDEGVWIHQNAWFHLGKFDKEASVNYTLKDPKNGVYAFVLNGDFSLNDQELNQRDGMGIWDVNELKLTAKSDQAEILLMEVPMNI